MRFVLALGLLIALCASACATTVRHAKPPTTHLRERQHFMDPRGQGVTPPGRFAVPGWTDEQTRQWLDSTRPWHQA